MALDFYVDHFSQSLVAGDAGTVVVRVGDEAWTAGTGAAVATVTAGRLELFRAFGGRLGEAEVRGLAWTGDVDRVLPFVSAYPS